MDENEEKKKGRLKILQDNKGQVSAVDQKKYFWFPWQLHDPLAPWTGGHDPFAPWTGGT